MLVEQDARTENALAHYAFVSVLLQMASFEVIAECAQLVELHRTLFAAQFARIDARVRGLLTGSQACVAYFAFIHVLGEMSFAHVPK